MQLNLGDGKIVFKKMRGMMMTNDSKSIARKSSIYADLSLLLVAIVWGGGFVAMKDALNYIQPFYIMTIRFGFSAFFLAVIFVNKLKFIRTLFLNLSGNYA